MAAKVTVNAIRYERNHGAAPRGFGMWAFCKVDPNAMDYLDHVIWRTGKFGEAKRAAVAEAKALGVTTLFVCP